MFDQTLFERILGPTMSDAEISALGSTEASYISIRNTKLDQAWAIFQDGSYDENGNPIVDPYDGQSFINVNLYDRVRLYYSKWQSSGYTDTVSRDRARAIATFYLPNYTKNYTDRYATSPWLEMYVGSALFYADTGHAGALSMLEYWGSKTRSSIWLARIGSTTGSPLEGYDGRTTGYGLDSLIFCHVVGGADISNPDIGSLSISTIDAIRQCVNQIIAGRDSYGIWRYLGPGGSDGMAKPWMVGLILESLINYDRLVEQDSRVPGVIQGACEYLYTATSAALQVHAGAGAHFYEPTSHSFYYIEGTNTLEPQPDFPYPPTHPVLEGLIINAFAYTYLKTGDPLWKTRANHILGYAPLLTTYSGVDALDQNYFGGRKGVNEAFARSYMAFGLLYGTAEPTGTLSPTEARDVSAIAGRAGTKLRLNWV